LLRDVLGFAITLESQLLVGNKSEGKKGKRREGTEEVQGEMEREGGKQRVRAHLGGDLGESNILRSWNSNNYFVCEELCVELRDNSDLIRDARLPYLLGVAHEAERYNDSIRSSVFHEDKGSIRGNKSNHALRVEAIEANALMEGKVLQ